MEMKEKAMKAATKVVEGNGCEVIARDLAYEDLPGRADLVIADGDTVAVASVDGATADSEGFPEPSERLAAMVLLLHRWCEESGHNRYEARVDAISVSFADEHHADVRWCKGRIL